MCGYWLNFPLHHHLGSAGNKRSHILNIIVMVAIITKLMSYLVKVMFLDVSNDIIRN